MANNYRNQIYHEYVSHHVKLGNIPYSEIDFDDWARGAKIRLRNWLPANLDTPVIDLGCGAGNFLYMMQMLGYSDLTGVDISPEQVALAQRWCPQSTIFKEDIFNVLRDKKDHYGLITGFDIIEHIKKEDVLPFLELVWHALLPEGRLILQTPNAESLFWGVVGYADFTHEWFFTPSILRNVLNLIGFVDYEARESGPFIHGFKSFIRFILWRLLRAFPMIWNLVETGGIGSGIYTRVFIATAIKSSDEILGIR